jgi:hypothetical protein
MEWQNPQMKNSDATMMNANRSALGLDFVSILAEIWFCTVMSIITFKCRH